MRGKAKLNMCVHLLLDRDQCLEINLVFKTTSSSLTSVGFQFITEKQIEFFWSHENYCISNQIMIYSYLCMYTKWSDNPMFYRRNCRRKCWLPWVRHRRRICHWRQKYCGTIERLYRRRRRAWCHRRAHSPSSPSTPWRKWFEVLKLTMNCPH